MDSQTANKVEYILSGYGVLQEDFNELIDLMDSYKKQESKDENLPIPDVMPRSLTAENGAKELLIGEFVECYDPDGSGNPYIVPITWDSIKNIYKRIVEHYIQ